MTKKVILEEYKNYNNQFSLNLYFLVKLYYSVT